MGDPSPEAWNRVRRYASWMRQVSVDEWSDVAEDTFRKLHLSSPHGGWFPALQDLSLRITEPNVPYADLLFSPHLKTISIYVPWSQIHPEVSRDDLAVVASNISALPTSTSTLSIRSIRIGCSTHLVYFKDSLLRRVTLWTITYGVGLPDPAVGCGSKSFNSTSPPPYLVHRKSSTRLLHFTFTTRFPTSHGIHDWRSRCTWMDFPV